MYLVVRINLYVGIHHCRYVSLFLSYTSSMLIKWICISSVSASLTFIWLHYLKKRTKNCTKVLFYEPIIYKTCHCKRSFDINCLSENCSSFKTREIILCLGKARKTMDICMFAISNKPIAMEIIAAYKRGVLIRIIVSNCVLFESKEINAFKKIGIKIKYQDNVNSSYMHNKFAIVDSAWLIQGSMNWTHQATYGNWENSIITNLQSLVIPFSIGFEKTWEKTILVT